MRGNATQLFLNSLPRTFSRCGRRAPLHSLLTLQLSQCVIVQLCDAGRNPCVLLFAGELICACMFQSRKPRGALRTRALFYLAKQRTFCRLEKLLDGYIYAPPGLSRLVACRCLWMQVGCLGLTGCLRLLVDACGCLLLIGCLWLPENLKSCIRLT